MTKIFDLPEDLVREILSRVPLMTSLSTVRSSCKKWNTLSKEKIFGKAESARMGFMVLNNRVCSIKFDFQRIRNESIDPPIKQISNFHQIEMCKIFYCDGLLLCIAKDQSRLLVWNPYLGQTSWIQTNYNFHDLSWSSSRNMYALGYDNNNNLKILRVLAKKIFQPEIYCLNSSSWKVLDVMNPGGHIRNYQSGVSLKGNTYFSASDITETFLVCFDFTEERFGPRLSLPFKSWDEDLVTLSHAREDQLAVLYQREHEDDVLEIWISTKIESNAVSWSKFLEVDMKKLNDVSDCFEVADFFIDEEKKLVVVCDCNTNERDPHEAYILGENEYFKSVKMREASSLREFDTNWDLLGFSNYVPSLVQLQTNPTLKRKRQVY